MKPERRAAKRFERIQTYRLLGSSVAIGLVLAALMGGASAFSGVWRLAILPGVLLIYVAYPIGELVGMWVATRGLSETDKIILNGLSFIDRGDGNASVLRSLMEHEAADVERWLRAIADHHPPDELARRAQRALTLLGIGPQQASDRV